MDIMNQKVKHKFYGEGVIIAQDDDSITIEFARRTSKFKYNSLDTFSKFITFSDLKIQESVICELEDKAAAERARLEEENKLKFEKESANFNADLNLNKNRSRQKQSKLPRANYARVSGKPMTFYVFQGSTFNVESQGGFIWAPNYSENGNKVFHWDNLLLVKEGDIILHGCNSYVVAVSIAISECYDCERPKERNYDGAWNNAGRRVDLKYSVFANPIKTSNFHDDILQYCRVKYSPFDKDGNGNNGYLFELNRDLAYIFLKAAVQDNSYLLDEKYIKEFLDDDTL